MDLRYFFFILAGACVGGITGWFLGRLIPGYAIRNNWPGISRDIATFVSSKLMSKENMLAKLTRPENYEKLMPVIEKHIDEFLRDRLKIAIPMIGMLIGERTISQLKLVFMKELEVIFPTVLAKYVDDIGQEINLDAEIERSLLKISPADIQNIMMPFAVKFACVVGIASGILTGLTNALILNLYH